jgi:hypothetical protein
VIWEEINFGNLREVRERPNNHVVIEEPAYGYYVHDVDGEADRMVFEGIENVSYACPDFDLDKLFPLVNHRIAYTVNTTETKGEDGKISHTHTLGSIREITRSNVPGE